MPHAIPNAGIQRGRRVQRLRLHLRLPQLWRPKLLPWIAYFLAFSFYLLTVLYAWHPEFVSKLDSIGGSPAKALQLLAILSGIANPLLSSTIGQSIDILRGILISRPRGHNLMDDLALQRGIGLDGLWDIIRLRRLPRQKPRAWAVFKIMSMIVVPILAILILTNVDSEMTFYPATTLVASRGYSIGSFNASLALLLNPMTDLTFSTRFKDFLSDLDRSIETTTEKDRQNCANYFNLTCLTSYFVPGGIENFAAALLAGKNFTKAGSIQPVLALDQRGYAFEFEDEDSMVNYDLKSDCIVSGFVVGAFQLCLKNRAPHELLAYITSCPRELATNAACLHDTSWYLKNGWRVNLATYTRFATVAYNGLNGTILSHTYSNESKTPVSISATELLHVYDTLLAPVNQTSAYGQKLSLLGLGSNRPVLPLSIWEYFQAFQQRAAEDSRTNRQAAVGLQSLLALTLYHCQNKDFNELRKLLLTTGDGDGDAAGSRSGVAQTVGQDIMAMFPSVQPDTDIVPAMLRYNLKVDRSVLLAYVVLSGTTLALCLAALVVGSCTGLGRRRRVPEFSSFPPLDQFCDCEMQYCDGGARVPRGDLAPLKGEGPYEQLLAAAKMCVVLAPERGPGRDVKEEMMEEDEEDERDLDGLYLRSNSASFAPSMLKSHFY